MRFAVGHRSVERDCESVKYMQAMIPSNTHFFRAMSKGEKKEITSEEQALMDKAKAQLLWDARRGLERADMVGPQGW